MNKKIMLGIFTVFLLVGLSFVVSGIHTNKTIIKESPLYRIRTKRAISEKILEIKTKFLQNRIFFQLPLLLKTPSDINYLNLKSFYCKTAGTKCTIDCLTARCTKICTHLCTRNEGPLCT
jgi:hypothetical protein